jgi:hypothetical protein
MKERSPQRRFAAEALEGRALMSTVAYGDFNNDGLVDVAELTTPTTVTVSLARADGSFTVAAVLATPKNRPAFEVYVGDYNGDGKLDVNAVGGSNGGALMVHKWLGNGDGTFGSRTSDTIRFGHIGHGGLW